MRIGWIAGTGFAEALPESVGVTVETAHGAVEVRIGRLPGHEDREVVFLPRHGEGHAVPPHRIRHRAHLLAMRACAVDGVFAVHNTGGLRATLGAGHLVVPDDLVDMDRDYDTLFEDEPVHVDMTEPFSPALRAALIASMHGSDWPADARHEEGVYVGVRGPRLETAAETRWFATLGDIVGMTGAREATAAREAGVPYASLSFVANAAAGHEGAELASDAIRDALAHRRDRLVDVLVEASARLEPGFACPSRTAPERGRFH